MAEETSTAPQSVARRPELSLGTDTVGKNQGDAYPPPQASYEEVVARAELFTETLVQMHSLMGTKLKVPTIGGKALNLHQLFVQVTRRGGLEKVIKERRWRDVIATFNFPSTITSASFVLRKYYHSLLYHYEQVYFFRKSSFDTSSDAPQPAGVSVASHGSGPSRTNRSPQGVSHPPPGYIRQDAPLVTGQITGKFDLGYLVTANFGSEKLAGVLYHVPFQVQNPPDPPQFVPKRLRSANIGEQNSVESGAGFPSSQAGEGSTMPKPSVCMEKASSN